jgi:uncharacterized glyoxalase superfamily protein PhnB
LDHIALACDDETELERVAAALTEAGVENTGVKLDETLGKRYVAFKDPDRIAWSSTWFKSVAVTAHDKRFEPMC